MFKQKNAKNKTGDEKILIACIDFGLVSLRAVENTCTFMVLVHILYHLSAL